MSKRPLTSVVRLVDALAKGQALGAPASSEVKALFDDHLRAQKGSVRLATVFFVAYAVVCKKWDFKSVPVGIRGATGDKKLGSALTERHVTFHNAITAFGENLGWKGNVRRVDLRRDSRFAPFLSELKTLSIDQRQALLNHVAWVLFSSRAVPQAMPILPREYLSYARSLLLCEKLLAVQSEGHIQQFLVAAFLEIHRKRFSHRIVTHHPHAADKFDRTMGDIEEFREYDLVAAYEVTARPDWKNRLPDFAKKVAEGKLAKYVIFAAGVNNDPDLRPATKLLDFTSGMSIDLAVVDLRDFFAVFCAELARSELAQAFNRAYELLAEPSLSGRADFMRLFRDATDGWLDMSPGHGVATR